MKFYYASSEKELEDHCFDKKLSRKSSEEE